MNNLTTSTFIIITIIENNNNNKNKNQDTNFYLIELKIIGDLI
jgi:hypothetical protein